MRPTAIEAGESFLAEAQQLDRELAGGREPAWLHELRSSALARFQELGFPTTRQEAWKYTNVAPIARGGFRLAPPVAAEQLPAEAIEAHSYSGLKGSELVFVNGRFAPSLSSLGTLPDGVLVSSLAEALRLDPECVRLYLARHADFGQRQAFTALNTAFLQDGAFVYVPGGLTLEEPIHLLHVTVAGGEPIMTHPRSLIVLQRASKASIVESYVGIGQGPYLTNAVTELLLEDGAIGDHVKIQREGEAAFHVARFQALQARDSHLESVSISLGGALVRNALRTRLDGTGAGCGLDGLYLTRGKQHVDNHTSIDHAHAHGTSRQLYKGVLDGRSSAVFNGEVLVRKDAQKTNAQQNNRNLLLSEGSTIDTKPQLEIHADDVKCTHGATIGQIDEDALFYLRTRGIDPRSARSLLVYAFATEVLERLQLAPVRAQMESLVLDWFGQSQGGQE